MDSFFTCSRATRIRWAALVGVCVALATTVTRAQEGGLALGAPPIASGETAARAAGTTLEVTLATGELVRGTLIELIPGERLVIGLTSGEERRYPWSLVRGFRSVDDAAASPPVPAPDANVGPRSAPATSMDPSNPDHVNVHVNAARPGLRVELRVGTQYAGTVMSASQSGHTTSYYPRAVYVPVYTPVCSPPCDLSLHVGVRYELRARAFEWTNTMAGIRPSRLWVTSDLSGLTVDFVNLSRFRRAAWIAVAVLPLMGVGAIFLARDLPHTVAGRNGAMFWTGIGLVATPSFSFMVPMMVRDRTRLRRHRTSQ